MPNICGKNGEVSHIVHPIPYEGFHKGFAKLKNQLGDITKIYIHGLIRVKTVKIAYFYKNGF